MAPLVEATALILVSTSSDGAFYEGNFDLNWRVGSVPNGGYSLGIVNICVHDYLAKQVKSAHTDLFHISSTYLNATDVSAKWVTEVRVTKRGKAFTNVDAILRQKSPKTGEILARLQTTCIYTNFGVLQSDESTKPITIPYDSPYYSPPICSSDPEDCTKDIFKDLNKILYRDRMSLFRDDKAETQHRRKGELSSAGYLYFTKDQVAEQDIAHFNNAAIILLSDVTDTNLTLISKSLRENDFWYPTMYMSIEVKRAMPPFALLRAASVTRTRHVNSGQHEKDVEIWSHPDDAEKFQLPLGVKSVILCIARQVALVIPLSIQKSIVEKKSKM